MASKCPPESSPALHFDTLLNKRQLHEGMTFKPVHVHVLEFGPNALNTSNFIEKVTELAQTESVKKSGGFMLIRPQNGVNIFTNPGNDDTKEQKTHSNANVWDALPALHNFAAAHNLLFEEQKAHEFTVGLFAWNMDHKNAIIEQNTFKRNQSKQFHKKDSQTKAEAVFKVNANDPMQLMLITDTNSPNTDDYKTGQKRKKNPEISESDIAQPRKRQKTDTRAPSPSLLSYNTDSTQSLTTNNSNNSVTNSAGFTLLTNDNGMKKYFNAKDLQFYRGFCCMTRNKKEFNKANIKQYITQLQTSAQTQKCVYTAQDKIEDKYLTFIKHFYDENTARYAHIEGSDEVTLYHKQSPFKAENLRHYGPFSCLSDEECTAGIQAPYMYVGDTHAFFPWHNEDMNFHAINHLLYGSPKIWFCIASADYSKVMKYFHKQFKYYYTDCLTPLQHKNCLMDPYIFSCLGINVYYIVQMPGDIVIAPPGGLHCGFNESFNIAQSVNFMTFSDKQWKLSLSAMCIKSYNFHDCSVTPSIANNRQSTPCICCNKQCTNPEQRFQCKCKFCDPLKCPCDYNIFYDINTLAQRCCDKYENISLDIIPKYPINEAEFKQKYGYEYKITHPRTMSDDEIDKRWYAPPQCQLEFVYPTQDRKDKKFYPAICYNNRIIKRDELVLTYQYQMDFIAFGEYYQICDETQIVWPGGFSMYEWNNPVIEKQHGFYTNQKSRSNRNRKKKAPNKVLATKLKGTPSFDYLKIELNTESPLIGTGWEHESLTFTYAPGARKYNLDIRKQKVRDRHEKEKQYRIQQITQAIPVASDDSRIKYHIEEYKDTESSSTSNSEDRLFESTDEERLRIGHKRRKRKNRDSDSDNAWTPEGNKWTKSLPEYQYSGLRQSRHNTRSKMKGSISIGKIDPLIDRLGKGKRKRGRPKKSKAKGKSDSEDEYILGGKDMYDEDSDYSMDTSVKRKKRGRKKASKTKKKGKAKGKKKGKKTKSKEIVRKKRKSKAKGMGLPMVPNMNAMGVITSPAQPSLITQMGQNNIFNTQNIYTNQPIHSIQNMNTLSTINNSINQVLQRPQRIQPIQQIHPRQVMQMHPMNMGSIGSIGNIGNIASITNITTMSSPRASNAQHILFSKQKERQRAQNQKK